MIGESRSLTLHEWDAHYARLKDAGLDEPAYGGPLSRHQAGGDRRLGCLRFDGSAAALRLWNFLLTEEERLREAAAGGRRIIGVMKDLGTIPVMTYGLDEVRAFYPDGAWWIPCIMEGADGLLQAADSLGIPETFCPVRALLGAFETGTQFPRPELLVCSAGATCDDLAAIAARVESLGFPVFWWEMPHRLDADESGRPDAAPGAGTGVTQDRVLLPGGFVAERSQVDFVRGELERVRRAIEDLLGHPLDESTLAAGIRHANRVRRILMELRSLVFRADSCPLPALELLVAEMLALHCCSDPAEAPRVLGDLLAEVRGRLSAGVGVLPAAAVRVFWVNPVADLRVMNVLEESGGRICGTDYMICHALDLIPEDLPPLEALARTALADPMTGSAGQRAGRICRDALAAGSEAVVISRIPGASHCGLEGQIIADIVRRRLGLPTVEIEVPSNSDALLASLRTRLEALVETARGRRRP